MSFRPGKEIEFGGLFVSAMVHMRREILNLWRAVHIASAVAAIFIGGSADALALTGRQAFAEAYIHEPIPPFVQVVGSEVDGPLFADASGHTLYVWPLFQQSGGVAGEAKGKPDCGDIRYEKTIGAMSPWPAGLELPDLDSRPTCTQLWPPVYADDDAKPVGKWSIVTRKDGRKQWAYDGYALYISTLDREPGDAIGGGILHAGIGTGAARIPIGPMPDVPAQFAVETIRTGRLLTLVSGFSVYVSDKDDPGKSKCDDICQRTWQPILAPAIAPQRRGEWSVIEPAPGIFQWAFRKKPLYTLIGDEQTRSFHGVDIPGWNNVYTQRAPAWPNGFTVQDAPGGQVLADSQGKTIYLYDCIDDAFDQQSCDHPSLTQTYRMAVCGGSDPARCLAMFPYVVAGKTAESSSRIWSVKVIDPMTGRFAAPDAPGALRVWSYRDRPIYTFAKDRSPGDTKANSWGENTGWRNGFHAFWVREEFRKQF